MSLYLYSDQIIQIKQGPSSPFNAKRTMPQETYQIQASRMADGLLTASQTTDRVHPSLSETHPLLIIMTCQIRRLCSHYS